MSFEVITAMIWWVTAVWNVRWWKPKECNIAMWEPFRLNIIPLLRRCMDTKIVNEYHNSDKYIPIHCSKAYSPFAGHFLCEMWRTKWHCEYFGLHHSIYAQFYLWQAVQPTEGLNNQNTLHWYLILFWY